MLDDDDEEDVTEGRFIMDDSVSTYSAGNTEIEDKGRKYQLLNSPMLMPPLPISVPKQFQPKHPATQFFPKVQQAKIFNCKESSKLVEKKMFPGTNQTNSVPAVQNKRSSVPLHDICCCITNNCELNVPNKHAVLQQIKNDIYQKKEQKNRKEDKEEQKAMTVEKKEIQPNTWFTPKKCSGDFGIAVTQSIRNSKAPFKVNEEHFRKKFNVDTMDIDVNPQPYSND